jgi:hypothetical protein
MGKSIDASDLVKEVMNELKTYEKLSVTELEKIAKKVAQEGRKKLIEASPRGTGSRKGHYADGWTVSAVKTGTDKFEFVVHNKKKPGLTHLLENGHVLRQGGRAEAIVHIQPVEEWCNEEFERRVKERLERL